MILMAQLIFSSEYNAVNVVREVSEMQVGENARLEGKKEVAASRQKDYLHFFDGRGFQPLGQTSDFDSSDFRFRGESKRYVSGYTICSLVQ